MGFDTWSRRAILHLHQSHMVGAAVGRICIADVREFGGEEAPMKIHWCSKCYAMASHTTASKILNDMMAKLGLHKRPHSKPERGKVLSK